MFFVPLQGKRLKLTLMTRKEAQKAILKMVNEEIKKHGENAIFCASPQRGKNAWTYKEFKEAVIADKPLENGGENTPIDDYLNFERYKTEHHNGKNT